MAKPPEMMPEGTDAIIPGASADDDTDFGYAPAPDDFAPAREPVADLKDKASDLKDDAVRVVGEKTAGLRDQAADKARAFAIQGKDKATDAIDNVVRLVDDAAGTIDAKVGEQYGDYVRRAGDALAGVAEQIRAKDVDELLDDAREVVRKSPALAIGAAAAVGFLIARVVKVAAAPHPGEDTPSSEPASPAGSPASAA